MVDERLRLAWEEGRHAVDYQARSLDELRSRAVAVLSAASISAAFLASAVLRGDAEHGRWTWIGTAAFAVVGVLVTWVVAPRKGWTFHRSADRILASYIEGTDGTPMAIDDMHHDLARHLSNNFDANRPKLNRLFTALTVAAGALAVEIVAFLVDLAVR